eukprot:653609-Pelagomonas_calceolata.AAC.6
MPTDLLPLDVRLETRIPLTARFWSQVLQATIQIPSKPFLYMLCGGGNLLTPLSNHPMSKYVPQEELLTDWAISCITIKAMIASTSPEEMYPATCDSTSLDVRGTSGIACFSVIIDDIGGLGEAGDRIGCLGVEGLGPRLPASKIGCDVGLLLSCRGEGLGTVGRRCRLSGPSSAYASAPCASSISCPSLYVSGTC